MIDGNNFFDQPVESDMRTCDNILKIATGKEDDYTTGCLLDYNYIKKDKMIAIDLSKQEGLIQNQQKKLILLEIQKINKLLILRSFAFKLSEN